MRTWRSMTLSRVTQLETSMHKSPTCQVHGSAKINMRVIKEIKSTRRYTYILFLLKELEIYGHGGSAGYVRLDGRGMHQRT